jgi:hypothetical protein
MSASGRVEFIENIRKALDRNDSFQRSLDDMIKNEPDDDDLRLLENHCRPGHDSSSGAGGPAHGRR